MGATREIAEKMRKQAALQLPAEKSVPQAETVVDFSLKNEQTIPRLPETKEQLEYRRFQHEQNEIKRLSELGIWGRFKARTWDQVKENFPKFFEASSYLIAGGLIEIYGLADQKGASNLKYSYKTSSKEFFGDNSIWGKKDEAVKKENFRQELKKLNLFSYAADGIINPIFGAVDCVREELTRGSLFIGKVIGRFWNPSQSLEVSYQEFRELEQKESLLQWSKELFNVAEVCLSLAVTLASGGTASSGTIRAVSKSRTLTSWLIKEKGNISALLNRLGVSGLFGLGGALGEELLGGEGTKINYSQLIINTKEGTFHSLKFGAISAFLPKAIGTGLDKTDALGDVYEVAVTDTDRILEKDEFGNSPDAITIIRRSAGLITKSAVSVADLYDNPRSEVEKIKRRAENYQEEFNENITEDHLDVNNAPFAAKIESSGNFNVAAAPAVVVGTNRHQTESRTYSSIKSYNFAEALRYLHGESISFFGKECILTTEARQDVLVYAIKESLRNENQQVRQSEVKQIIECETNVSNHNRITIRAYYDLLIEGNIEKAKQLEEMFPKNSQYSHAWEGAYFLHAHRLIGYQQAAKDSFDLLVRFEKEFPEAWYLEIDSNLRILIHDKLLEYELLAEANDFEVHAQSGILSKLSDQLRLNNAHYQIRQGELNKAEEILRTIETDSQLAKYGRASDDDVELFMLRIKKHGLMPVINSYDFEAYRYPDSGGRIFVMDSLRDRLIMKIYERLIKDKLFAEADIFQNQVYECLSDEQLNLMRIINCDFQIEEESLEKAEEIFKRIDAELDPETYQAIAVKIVKLQLQKKDLDYATHNPVFNVINHEHRPEVWAAVYVHCLVKGNIKSAQSIKNSEQIKLDYEVIEYCTQDAFITCLNQGKINELRLILSQVMDWPKDFWRHEDIGYEATAGIEVILGNKQQKITEIFRQIDGFITLLKEKNVNYNLVVTTELLQDLVLAAIDAKQFSWALKLYLLIERVNPYAYELQSSIFELAINSHIKSNSPELKEIEEKIRAHKEGKEIEHQGKKVRRGGMQFHTMIVAREEIIVRRSPGYRPVNTATAKHRLEYFHARSLEDVELLYADLLSKLPQHQGKEFNELQALAKGVQSFYDPTHHRLVVPESFVYSNDRRGRMTKAMLTFHETAHEKIEKEGMFRTYDGRTIYFNSALSENNQLATGFSPEESWNFEEGKISSQDGKIVRYTDRSLHRKELNLEIEKTIWWQCEQFLQNRPDFSPDNANANSVTGIVRIKEDSLTLKELFPLIHLDGNPTYEQLCEWVERIYSGEEDFAARNISSVMSAHSRRIIEQILELNEFLEAMMPAGGPAEFYRSLLIYSASNILDMFTDGQFGRASHFPVLADSMKAELILSRPFRQRLIHCLFGTIPSSFELHELVPHVPGFRETPWTSSGACLAVSLGVKTEVQPNASFGDAVFEILAAKCQLFDTPHIATLLDKHNWKVLIQSPQELFLFLLLVSRQNSRYAQQALYFLSEQENSLLPFFQEIYQRSRQHLRDILSNDEMFLVLLENAAKEIDHLDKTNRNWIKGQISQSDNLLLVEKIKKIFTLNDKQQEIQMQYLVNVWLRMNFPQNRGVLSNKDVTELVEKQLLAISPTSFSLDFVKIRGMFFCAAINTLSELGYKNEVCSIYQNSQFAGMLKTLTLNSRGFLQKYTALVMLCLQKHQIPGMFISGAEWDKVDAWNNLGRLQYVINHSSRTDKATAESGLIRLMEESDSLDQNLRMGWITDKAIYDEARQMLEGICLMFFELNSRLVGEQRNLARRTSLAEEILNIIDYLLEKVGVFPDGELKLGSYNKKLLGEDGNESPEFIKLLSLRIMFSWLITNNLNEGAILRDLDIVVDDFLSPAKPKHVWRNRVYQEVLRLSIFCVYPEKASSILIEICNQGLFEEVKRVNAPTVKTATSENPVKKRLLNLDQIGQNVLEFAQHSRVSGPEYSSVMLANLAQLLPPLLNDRAPNSLSALLCLKEVDLVRLLSAETYRGLAIISSARIGDLASAWSYDLFIEKPELCNALALGAWTKDQGRFPSEFDKDLAQAHHLFIKGAQTYELMQAIESFDLESHYYNTLSSHAKAKRWCMMMHFLILIGGTKSVAQIVGNSTCPSYLTKLDGRIDELNGIAQRYNPQEYLRIIYYLAFQDEKFSPPTRFLSYNNSGLDNINGKALLETEEDARKYFKSEVFFDVGRCWIASQYGKLSQHSVNDKKDLILAEYDRFFKEIPKYKIRSNDRDYFTSSAIRLQLLAGILAALLDKKDVATANDVFRASEFGDRMLSGKYNPEQANIYLVLYRIFFTRRINLNGSIAGTSIQDLVHNIVENERPLEYAELCLLMPEDRSSLLEAANTLIKKSESLLSWWPSVDLQIRRQNILETTKFAELAALTLNYLDQSIALMSPFGKDKYVEARANLRGMFSETMAEALLQIGFLTEGTGAIDWTVVNTTNQKMYSEKNQILAYYLLCDNGRVLQQLTNLIDQIPANYEVARKLLQVYIFVLNRLSAAKVLKDLFEIEEFDMFFKPVQPK